MADFKDKKDVVTYGVRAFKRIEDSCHELIKDIGKLQIAFQGANDHQMCGMLQHMRVDADIQVAQGKVAEALVIVARLHREGTDMAIAHGVDQVDDGGGDVVILGGPGR